MKLFVQSIAIGTVTTLSLFWLGKVAAEADVLTLSYTLYWQAFILQSLLPCVSISFLEGPLCESEPLSMAVFYAGIPVGVAIYSTAAYGLLSWLRRRAARSSAPALNP